jgi:hypothetical protein
MRGGLALLTLDATQKSRAISFGDTRRFPRYGPDEQSVDQEIEEHRTLRCCDRVKLDVLGLVHPNST